jgi:hypothetical protein
MSQVQEAPGKKGEIETLSFIRTFDFSWKFLRTDFSHGSSGSDFKVFLKKFWKCFFYFFHCMNMAIYGSIFSYSKHITQRTIILEKLFLTLSLGGTMSILIVCYSCMHWKSDRIRSIFDKLPLIYSKEKVQKFHIDQRLASMRKFIKYFSLHECSSYVFMVLEPLGVYMQNGEKTFPFLFEFPFETSEIFIYVTICAWIYLAHTTHIIAMVSNDNVLYGLINVISLEFEILRRDFEDLRELSSAPARFRTKLLACVKRQIELHEMSEELQKVFNPSFVLNFVIISFIMCCNAFQMSTTTNFVEMAFSFLFCLSSTTHIFLQCFFGAMLKDASENVVHGVYRCGWEDLEDIQLKKCLVLIIERAQKPAALSI